MNGKILLDEYEVEGVKIRIYDENGIGYYEVNEPELNHQEKRIVDEILRELYYSDIKDIEEEIFKVVKNTKLSDESVEKIVYYIKKNIKYGELTPLILDPLVEEIECKGYGSPISIVHRKYSRKYYRLFTNIILESEDDVIRVIEKLANKANKSVNFAKPYLEFSLPEGHRVAATISKEISIPGSTFDIRKFPNNPITIIDLIKNGTLNEIIASYLWFLLDYKPFLMILGPTGSGKTTLLNSLLSLVNPMYKIVTIEDTPEINLEHKNWIRFVSRATTLGKYDISLLELSRLALRYRPDYMVIGEVRGKEIEALIHAAASGHGSITTFHGAKPVDAVTRILSLVNDELAQLFLQGIWGFIVLGSREMNGKNRYVSAIYEVIPAKGKIKFRKIVKWSYKANEYLPTSLEKIIEKSYRINWIIRNYEISKDEVIQNLQRRIEFLRKLLENDNLKFEEELMRFYIHDREKIVKII